MGTGVFTGPVLTKEKILNMHFCKVFGIRYAVKYLKFVPCVGGNQLSLKKQNRIDIKMIIKKSQNRY